MPSVQRGSVIKKNGKWAVRYYDENGRRRFHGGFATKSAGREWLDGKVDEIAALRRGDPAAIRRRQIPTVRQLVDEFLHQHNGEPATLRALRDRLRYALEGPAGDGQGGFAELRIDRLQMHEVSAWRKHLPPRSAWQIHKALRQVLNYAVRAKLLDENVATLVPNPEPKRQEIQAFATVAELESLAAEIDARFAAIPIFASLTGLRPQEWIALERTDVDLRAGIVHVRRVYADGKVRLYGKQAGSLRTVPLPVRAAVALDRHPTRLDTPLLFPSSRCAHIDLHSWREDQWNPSLRAAGLAMCSCGHRSHEHREGGCDHARCRCAKFTRLAGYRPPYSMRHTFATFSIAAGISLFELSRFMGTSVEQIDNTYGHLLPDALERAKSALDAFLAGNLESVAEGSGT